MSTCITVWSTLQNCMFLGNKGDSKRCARVWSRVVQICTSMSFLQVTCDAVRGLQCPKETCKRCTENRFPSFKPTRTYVDRTWSIFRNFCCGKTITSQGTQCLNLISKFRTMMTWILLWKWLFFERWKSLESWGCAVNPSGRTNLPNKKGCN